MSESVPYFDIILLAMLAGFIALRLISVLGRRTGHEPQDSPAPARSRDEENRHDRNGADDPSSDRWQRIGVDPDSALGGALADISSADRRFDPELFLSNARSAYEMIINAFAAGDRETLEPLLSEDVYAEFEEAISNREAADETWITEIVEPGDTAFEDAQLSGKTAEITVRFESDMVRVVRDSDDRVIAGNPSDTEHVIDLWTFARAIGQRDPNWLLVGTESVS